MTTPTLPPPAMAGAPRVDPPEAAHTGRLGARAAAGGDRAYRLAIALCAATVPALLGIVAVALVRGAWPALADGGAATLLTSGWDPVRERFALGPALAGTLLTAALALLVATPLALAAALWTAELAPARLRTPVAALVDLLAAVPGVVYGLWGVQVLVPWLLADVAPALRALPVVGGWAWLAGPSYGPSLLAASVVLAIMVLPFIAAVSREVLLAVPGAQREAALALGATRWETATRIVLPYAGRGVVGAVMLGLGRALGETIAVAMVVGGAHAWPTSLLGPGYTLGALVANEFGEASGDRHLAALMLAGLALFGVTLVVNALARWLVARVADAEADA